MALTPPYDPEQVRACRRELLAGLSPAERKSLLQQLERLYRCLPRFS